MGVLANALVRARAVIQDPQRWTQGWFAKDSNGRECGSLDPEAVAWDMMGAVRRACVGEGPPVTSLIYACRRALQSAANGLELSYVNDFGSHRRVIETFDAAIKRCS